MYLKLRKIWIGLLLLGSISSCVQDNLNYVVHSRRRVNWQLEKFGAKNDRFYKFAKEKLLSIDELVREGNTGFQSTPRKWNTYTLKIKYEFDGLRRELSALDFKQKEFLTNMSKIIQNIAQVDIRRSEMNIHTTFKKNWQTNHKMIEQKMDSINCMLEVTFPDFHKILLGSNLHGKKKYSLEFLQKLIKELDDSYATIQAAIKRQTKLITETEFENAEKPQKPIKSKPKAKKSKPITQEAPTDTLPDSLPRQVLPER